MKNPIARPIASVTAGKFCCLANCGRRVLIAANDMVRSLKMERIACRDFST